MSTQAMAMLNGPAVLFPAYGRTYATVEDMRAAWDAGKDFRFPGGPYCSVRDLDKIHDMFSTVWILDPVTRVQTLIG